MFSFSNVNAQDQNNPWQLNFGVNAVDFYPVGEDAPRGGYFDEFVNATRIIGIYYLLYQL